MRIVFIIPDLGEGGIFEYYHHFIPYLSRIAQVHIVFASPLDGPVTPKIEGATCHVVTSKDARLLMDELLKGPLIVAPFIARSVAVAHSAWQKAISLAPDCVEVCDWPLSLGPAILAQSVPYVVQCHGSMGQVMLHDPPSKGGFEPALLEMLESRLIASALRVQTSSTSNAAFWEASSGRAVEVMRPAFALPETQGGSAINDAAVVFGRLQSWKGPQVLCEAQRLLGSRSPTVNWFGGMKPWSNGLNADRHLASQYPDVFGRRLHHHPPVPRSTVYQMQAQALFNLVPSTWDVLNFAALGAMASGRPLIVSTGTGASELIEDGENGLTFENGSAEGLATAIDRVMTMPERRRREIGERARETIRAKLNPELIAEKRLVAFKEAVSAFDIGERPLVGQGVATLLRPPSHGTSAADDLLSSVPMKKIAAHLAKRLVRKTIER